MKQDGSSERFVRSECASGVGEEGRGRAGRTDRE